MDFAAIRQRLFSLHTSGEFNELAVEIFRYQVNNNPIYGEFCRSLGVNDVAASAEIPFLPISFFKTHRVVTGDFPGQLIFQSSGTTGTVPSYHHVADFSLYEESFMRSFRMFYGDLSGYCIFALLPSYQERGNSSLIYMVERMRWKSDLAFGGFYLNEPGKLVEELKQAYTAGKKIILFGVTYALLELSETCPVTLPGAIIFETGGMKGRRKEITRMELHQKLRQGFGVDAIHSEYGMTELLSQAWSSGEGIFRCPPWMEIRISDPNDPLDFLGEGRTGGIDVIDLANIHSCSFIATRDLGIKYADGSFEVLGRFDSSDIRGCSLLVS